MIELAQKGKSIDISIKNHPKNVPHLRRVTERLSIGKAEYSLPYDLCWLRTMSISPTMKS